jgi:hypothetical protein
MDGICLYGIQVVGLVLLSFVMDLFCFTSFPMFFFPTNFSLLDFVREFESAPIIWADSVCRRPPF